MAMIRKRGKTYQIDYFDLNGKRVRKSFKNKKDGEAKPVTKIKRSFSSVLKRAGVVDFRFHDLRQLLQARC